MHKPKRFAAIVSCMNTIRVQLPKEVRNRASLSPVFVHKAIRTQGDKTRWTRLDSRRSAVMAGGSRVLAATLVLAMWPAACSQPSVVSITPSRGSLAGGTRMLIKGQGFSTNTGGRDRESPAMFPRTQATRRPHTQRTHKNARAFE